MVVDISDNSKIIRRRAEVTDVVRRRRRSERRGVDLCRGDALVIADLARHHDHIPQHLWNWIKTAKGGALRAAGGWTTRVGAGDFRGLRAGKRARAGRSLCDHRAKSRVPAGAETRDVEAVLRAFFAVQRMSSLMISPGPRRVLMAMQPVDFRRGMNGLAALVEDDASVLSSNRFNVDLSTTGAINGSCRSSSGR